TLADAAAWHRAVATARVDAQRATRVRAALCGSTGALPSGSAPKCLTVRRRAPVLHADYALTTRRSSTSRTPGACHAARSASRRSDQDLTFPLRVILPSEVSTVIRSAST